MQNQIMNQLLLFGIQPGEYQITTHAAGETEITVLGNTVAIIPMIGRKAIQLNREWTLDRIPSDSLVLAVSAVIAALLRCRRPQSATLPPLSVPTLPAPRPQHGAAGTPWQRLGGLPALPISSQLSETMVEKTPSLRGGETATIPRLGIYPTDNHSPEDYE